MAAQQSEGGQPLLQVSPSPAAEQPNWQTDACRAFPSRHSRKGASQASRGTKEQRPWFLRTGRLGLEAQVRLCMQGRLLWAVLNNGRTTSLEHPGTLMIATERGDTYIGGRIWGLALPTRDFPCLTAGELRAELPPNTDVVAFQCRNPVHRAHYELFTRALYAKNVAKVSHNAAAEQPTAASSREGMHSGLGLASAQSLAWAQPSHALRLSTAKGAQCRARAGSCAGCRGAGAPNVWAHAGRGHPWCGALSDV